MGRARFHKMHMAPEAAWELHFCESIFLYSLTYTIISEIVLLSNGTSKLIDKVVLQLSAAPPPAFPTFPSKQRSIRQYLKVPGTLAINGLP